ncbi:MAG: hypothetical protein ABR905_20125, partial [Terracidiphilus sp.]
LIQNSLYHPVLLSQDDQLITHAKRIQRHNHTFRLFMRRPLAALENFGPKISLRVEKSVVPP